MRRFIFTMKLLILLASNPEPSFSFKLNNNLKISSQLRSKEHIYNSRNRLPPLGMFFVSDIPSGQPLQYIQPLVFFEAAYDAIKDATVPGNIDTFLAIAFAESIAGVVGGLASRGIANLIGDKKRDRAILKGASTGIYFGSRSLLAGLFTLLGIPKPIGRSLATLISTSASEIFKIAGRIAAENKIELDNKNAQEIFEVENETGLDNDNNQKIIRRVNPFEQNLNRYEKSNKYRNEDISRKNPSLFEDKVNNVYTPQKISSNNQVINRKSTIEKSIPTNQNNIINNSNKIFSRKIKSITDHTNVAYRIRRQTATTPTRTATTTVAPSASLIRKRAKENRLRSSITIAEVASDVSKWLMFDTLQSYADANNLFPTDSFLLHTLYSFLFGSLAGLVGGIIMQTMTESKKKDNTITSPYSSASSLTSSISSKLPQDFLKLLFATLEGGVLFAIYQASLTCLQLVVPATVGTQPFLFGQLLDQLEATAEDIIL